MRRINVCEERGSGIDKVVSSVETYQLPAPEFVVASNSLRVTLSAYKSLRQMSREDKIRACYQHCALKYVAGEYMSNVSLRERLRVEKKNYSVISRIISDTIRDGLVKQSNPESTSKKLARYVPFWA
jgi:ATP-dependent DNA helicase RecG